MLPEGLGSQHWAEGTRSLPTGDWVGQVWASSPRVTGCEERVKGVKEAGPLCRGDAWAGTRSKGSKSRGGFGEGPSGTGQSRWRGREAGGSRGAKRRAGGVAGDRTHIHSLQDGQEHEYVTTFLKCGYSDSLGREPRELRTFKHTGPCSVYA